jgi:nucleoside-diphosphate-sugar epimerase
MRVLVTGATGFVGRHVVSQLLERRHTVTAVARDEARARQFSWFDSIRFAACDIHRSVSNQMGSFAAQDAVMHLAWPGLPNYGSAFHVEENLPGSYRFLKSLVEAGVRQVLVTGTCGEYGLQSGALSEDIPPAPVTQYALAKDTLHKYLQALQQQHRYVLQWARLFYMYGPGQHANSLLSQLDSALDRGDAMFNMSGGEQLRDYLPIEDVALRLVSLLEHPDCTGTINICSGEPISVRRLVMQHLTKRGRDIQLNAGYYPYLEYEPMAFWGDCTKYSRYCNNV